MGAVLDRNSPQADSRLDRMLPRQYRNIILHFIMMVEVIVIEITRSASIEGVRNDGGRIRVSGVLLHVLMQELEVRFVDNLRAEYRRFSRLKGMFNQTLLVGSRRQIDPADTVAIAT